MRLVLLFLMLTALEAASSPRGMTLAEMKSTLRAMGKECPSCRTREDYAEFLGLVMKEKNVKSRKKPRKPKSLEEALAHVRKHGKFDSDFAADDEAIAAWAQKYHDHWEKKKKHEEKRKIEEDEDRVEM